jgi:AcrR family transcriptional regulator
MPRVRRTQEERSKTMRARLIDATITTLHDRGYARTSLPQICRRARVSRGAQLHHFRTKADLVTTAVEHIFEERTREFRQAIDTASSETDRVTAAIELLWSILSGPTFYAWLELVVAARTDARLRRTVAGLANRFIDSVRGTFTAIFPGVDPMVIPGFAFATLQGLAVDRIVVPEAPHIATSIEVLKHLGSLVIPHAEET